MTTTPPDRRDLTGPFAFSVNREGSRITLTVLAGAEAAVVVEMNPAAAKALAFELFGICD